jgi:ABC-type branched-subunit amino acid transport system substrate-binding protein
MARGTVRLGSSAIAMAVAVLVTAGVAGTQLAGAATASSKALSKWAPVTGLIAVEGPMSGEQAATGIDMANGAQLAIDQINAAGGIDGVRLTMLKLDDKATAAGGMAAARQAIASRAFAVVGPFNSSVGVVNLSTYAKARLPIVRLTSSVKTEGFGVTTQPMDSHRSNSRRSPRCCARSAPPSSTTPRPTRQALPSR